MRILYFAWLRERIGTGSEEVDPPAHVGTVEELIAWLGTREPRYEAAFTDLKAIRVAIDQEQAEFSDPIENAREIALFPPVTGG